uniref:Transposase n=1 Tax=Panagrellus redivivus TaxID=6233 RepID=A0A7E4UPV1_PANRE
MVLLNETPITTEMVIKIEHRPDNGDGARKSVDTVLRWCEAGYIYTNSLEQLTPTIATLSSPRFNVCQKRRSATSEDGLPPNTPIQPIE